jgi:hypothetical protein
MRVMSIAAGAVLALSLPAGKGLFTAAVVAVGLIGLLILQDAFAATGHRPVLIAAAIAGVAAPLRAAGDPQAGIAAAAGPLAAMLLAAFLLSIVGRRRHGIASAIGATGMAGVLVGVGGAALVALRGGRGGFRWMAAVLLLTVVPEIAAALAQRVRPDDRSAAAAARLVAIGVVAGALLAVASRPLGAIGVAALVVSAGAAALGADAFWRAMAMDAAATGSAKMAVTGVPTALRWLSALLAVAPLALLIARALQS